MIRRSWKYLHRGSKIARLPTDLVTPFTFLDIDRESELVMMAGAAKDPTAAGKLLKKYNVTTAAQLLPLLPKHKKPSLQSRLLRWAQRLEGSHSYDQLEHEIRHAHTGRRKQRLHRGYRETSLK